MDKETLELAEMLIKQYEQEQIQKAEHAIAREKLFRYHIIRTWDKLRRSQPMWGYTKLIERKQHRIVARFNDLRLARSHLSRLTFRYKTHDFRHLLLEEGYRVVMEG